MIEHSPISFTTSDDDDISSIFKESLRDALANNVATTRYHGSFIL